ncbi:MAG: UDP-N-acetylmuramoyl-L-alanyl-D-glutamate--2,6-diaminopimelate ligase [Kineosporiaceae bacterium]
MPPDVPPPSPAGPRPRSVPGYSLADLLRRWPQLEHRGAGRDPAQVELSGVSLDSRAIAPGDLYAALPGSSSHGAAFAAQAAAAGAIAVLTDPDGVRQLDDAGPEVLVAPRPRELVGEISAWVFGEPARRLRTFGVTGTNGKTTTTFLLAGALERVGRTCGLVGTVENRVGEVRLPSVRTTPEAPALQAMLAVMVEAGARDCALEISSHALRLHRVDGLCVDVAGFTNLSQDHLDFHPDMEDYFAAKAELFTSRHARRAVVCVDDAWGARMAAHARAQGLPTVTFALADADVTDADVRVRADGDEIVLVTPSGPLCRLLPPLPGSFNQANAALAVLMLVEGGMPAEEAARAVAAAGAVPGRMELVDAGLPPEQAARAPLALVDYAHTPAAVAAATASLRPRSPLVVVLGAGGDRDRDKRPLMGRAAADGADVVIVTDDNPRSEDPAAIRASVLAGAVQGGALVREVPDRREAVRLAVRLATPPGEPAGCGPGRGQGARARTGTTGGSSTLRRSRGAGLGRRASTSGKPFPPRRRSSPRDPPDPGGGRRGGRWPPGRRRPRRRRGGSRRRRLPRGARGRLRRAAGERVDGHDYAAAAVARARSPCWRRVPWGCPRCCATTRWPRSAGWRGRSWPSTRG